MGRKNTQGFPPYFHTRRTSSGSTYYYYELPRRRFGKRDNVPLGSDLDAALAKYGLLVKSRIQYADSAKPRDASAMWRSCKAGAAKRNIPFLLTEEDIAALLERSGGACELTGIRFSHKPRGRARRRAWIPSLDRINSGGPYTLANCRIVCAMANCAVSDLGDAAFDKLARAYIKKKYGISVPSEAHIETNAVLEN